MTRQEQYNQRSLVFSTWIRKNLPDSNTGYCVTNQDWVFYNRKTRRLMLAEEKTNLGRISPWFNELIINVLNPALKEYCPSVGIDYRGYHIIKFENFGPDDGIIILNNAPISKEDFIRFLSMCD